MKLHLPKILLTAVLSACSCAYAHSGWGTGTNNYCLDVDGGTTTTAFRGNISVQSGATLKIGDATELMQNWSVNMDSLKSLDLDGGSIRFFGANSSLSVLNVNKAANINSWQAGRNEVSGLHIGTVNLNANLALWGDYGSVFEVDELNGTGHINIDPYINGSSKLVLDVLSADSWTGQLNIDMKKQSLDRIDIVMADDWAGTVNLSNAANGEINLASLGAKATINMTDNELYLKVDPAGTSNIASSLKLNGNTKIING